jgi:hypothetical protein
MSEDNSVVAIYPSQAAVEAALKELQRSGFDMKKLSIVSRDDHAQEHVTGHYNTGNRMKWGLSFGSTSFWIPGVGSLLVAGPLVSWLVGALESAVAAGGLSAIGAGMCSAGIPKDSIVQYETALKTGRFVLIANGSIDEILHAKAILYVIEPLKLEHHSVNASAMSH